MTDTSEKGCAHCGDWKGDNDSMDTRRRVRCRGCGLLVCQCCADASTGQHCGDFTDLPNWPERLTGADYERGPAPCAPEGE